MNMRSLLLLVSIEKDTARTVGSSRLSWNIIRCVYLDISGQISGASGVHNIHHGQGSLLLRGR